MCLYDKKDADEELPSSTKTAAAAAAASTTKVPILPWPEDDESKNCCSNILFEWAYTYMNPVLQKGSQQTLDDGTHLSAEDLFRAPCSMESSLLLGKLNDYYQQAKPGKYRLHRALFRIAAPTFLPAGFCLFVSSICQVGIPLCVRMILNLVEKNQGQEIYQEGLYYVFLLFAVLTSNAFNNHRHRYLATKSGVILRGTLLSTVYQRVLSLSPEGRVGLTSGEVANMVSVDAQKLYEMTQEAHLIWSLPMVIILVTIALYMVMGPATFAGVVVLISFLPLMKYLGAETTRIRMERVQFSDERVEVTNSMFQGIKVAKLNNYERNYEERCKAIREMEVAALYRELATWAQSLTATVISPGVAAGATFILYTLISEDHILTASDSFTTLLLFNALRFPISYFGRMITRVAQAMTALDRLSEFLRLDLRDGFVTSDPTGSSNEILLSVKDAGFQITTTAPQGDSLTKSEHKALSTATATTMSSFEVSTFNFDLQRGEILAVCGPVGCGKSTFINGLVSEVPFSATSINNNGTVDMKGKIAFVSQTPFIMNTTLRENILFSKPYEKERYERVVEACCLWQDIKLLGEAGDLTQIGERGVTLSGGQKQRVCLARAAYDRPDIVLLDDPLSALDAGTSKRIFENLLRNDNGAWWCNTSVVLVTHAAHLLSRVDKVLVIAEGKSKFYGTWKELTEFETTDPKTHFAINHLRSSVQESSGEDKDSDDRNNPSSTAEKDSKKQEKKSSAIGSKDKEIMTVEERDHGLSQLHTWLLWFQRAGGIWYIFGYVIVMTIDRVTYVAAEYWVARWTEGANEPIDVYGIEFDAQTDGRSAQYDYVRVYAAMVICTSLATAFRSHYVVVGGFRCSKRMFLGMLSAVLRAPMSYFDTTPIGRLLNRFTYDVEVVDVTLTQSMTIFMISWAWGITSLIVMMAILPWLGFVIVPVTTMYWLLLLHYRKSGTDLQRLDALARSPVQAYISEALDGNMTIRIYQQEDAFYDKFYAAANASTAALLNFVAAQRWVGLRIEILGSLVVFAANFSIVAFNQVLGLEAGIAALLVIWASNFTITLGFLVDSMSEAEAAITSIERTNAMHHVPQEREMDTLDEKQKLITPSWPSKGVLEFDNVSMRYRPGLALSLNGLSFTIGGGQRCGVVGRTGAGKSSLTAALFRLVEIESGHILLDGVNLADLGLSDVRGRANGMAIIPQDPFLTGNTLRECVDPFCLAKDEDILAAIVAVRILDESNRDDGLEILNGRLEEGGSNYSVGERQLLNLARALLMKPRLLVLDEATASIDGETDAFIQQMLRTRFKDTTLITIAHRLNTIMDYDVILVMDKGKAVEFGPPMELLNRTDGFFADLVNSTGVESAKSLRAMAAAAAAANTTDTRTTE